MDYETKVSNAQKIHEKARYMRGRFLNTVAVLEHELATVITEYFCSIDEEKRELFFLKVAEKLSLQKKKEIFMDIIRRDYPSRLEGYQERLSSFQGVQTFRNKLAHSILDVSEDALVRPLEEGIGFIQWEKGEPITEQEFQEWEIKVGSISEIVREIRTLLPFKE